METYEEKQETVEQAQPVAEDTQIPEEAPQAEEPKAEEPKVEEPKVENAQSSDTSKQLRELERMIGSAFKDLSESLGNAAIWVKKTVDEKVDAVKQSREKEEDPFTKIEKLSHLRDIGAITLEEFNNKKAELLKKI